MTVRIIIFIVLETVENDLQRNAQAHLIYSETSIGTALLPLASTAKDNKSKENFNSKVLENTKVSSITIEKKTANNEKIKIKEKADKDENSKSKDLQDDNISYTSKSEAVQVEGLKMQKTKPFKGDIVIKEIIILKDVNVTSDARNTVKDETINVDEQKPLDKSGEIFSSIYFHSCR